MRPRELAVAEATERCSNEDTCRTTVQILDRIGDKWTVMVVGNLAAGPLRFNEILRRIDGLSHRMLTRTLRGLQQDGMVERRAFPTIPPKVEYELTPLGRSLIGPLWTLVEWAAANRSAIEEARAAHLRHDEEEAIRVSQPVTSL